jgi:MFS family permease
LTPQKYLVFWNTTIDFFESMEAPDATTPLLPRSTATSSTNLTISTSEARNDHINNDTSQSKQYDEETSVQTTSSAVAETSFVSVGRIVCVLLIGSFISNADGSLLMATHPIIASEFNALHDSSWLLVSFSLAQAVSQPLYGKLSDIYGRKSMILLAYTLFAVGMVLVGVGQSMTTLIIGRVISGAGSSGMTSLVSILITDLVPLRDVASWRSYVNIVATTGRSIGGPLGGWMADTVGWRWSFLGQAPIAGLAMVLIATTVPPRPSHEVDKCTGRSKIARIDFLGSICMTLSILGFLLPLEIGGDRVAWSSPVIIVLFAAAIVFGLLFLAVEGWVAKEPIVPLHLLRHRDIINSGFILFCQCAAQTGLMFAVPLYFQVTSHVSNSVAGAHLVPAVVGNALGGIISGAVINRTGRYKLMVLIATTAASIGFFLLIVRWHGSTNWLESLYIFPCGFAVGVVQSALFISVQAGIEPEFTAIAASMLYLTQPTGSMAGLAVTSAVLQGSLKQGLGHRLDSLGYAGQKKRKIIERAVSDVHYIDKAKLSIAKAIVDSYIEALTWTHGKNSNEKL